MTERLLISQSSLLWRTAVWSKDRLLEYREEPRGQYPVVGSIYRGRVHRILDSLSALSVDYGGSSLGFLPLDEISSESFSALGASAGIPTSFKKGQEVLVQIQRPARGSKGARLTSKFSLPGRYWVFLPCAAPEILVSKKLGDREFRTRIREMFTPLLEGSGGLVLRSVATLDSMDELEKELQTLRARWTEIQNQGPSLKTGEAAYHDLQLPYRALREQVSKDCSEIVVDDISLLDSIKESIQGRYGSLCGMMRLATGTQPLFDEYPVDSHLARATQRKVLLPSGGSLVFDETEAMVVVDVNAGRPDEKDAPYFRTNMEAAAELGVQLRLRDMTGIIVVDFINMKGSRDRRRIEDAVRDSLRMDPVKTQVYGMTELYLLQIVRSGGRRQSYSRSQESCLLCNGRGSLPSFESEGLRALHQSERLLMRKDVSGVELFAAEALLESLSSALSGAMEILREKYQKRIVLSAGPDYHSREYRIRAMHEIEPPQTTGK